MRVIDSKLLVGVLLGVILTLATIYLLNILSLPSVDVDVELLIQNPFVKAIVIPIMLAILSALAHQAKGMGEGRGIKMELDISDMDIRKIERSNAYLQVLASLVNGLGIAWAVAASAFLFTRNLIHDLSFWSMATLVAFGLVAMGVMILSLHLFREAIMVLFDEVAIPELVDIAFLPLWLAVLWLINRLGGMLALYGNVEQDIYSVFQLLFVITTVMPVVGFIFLDLVAIFKRGWPSAERE